MKSLCKKTVMTLGIDTFHLSLFLSLIVVYFLALFIVAPICNVLVHNKYYAKKCNAPNKLPPSKLSGKINICINS
jgi:hypothetical protein